MRWCLIKWIGNLRPQDRLDCTIGLYQELEGNIASRVGLGEGYGPEWIRVDLDGILSRVFIYGPDLVGVMFCDSSQSEVTLQVLCNPEVRCCKRRGRRLF